MLGCIAQSVLILLLEDNPIYKAGSMHLVSSSHMSCDGTAKSYFTDNLGSYGHSIS